MNNIWIALIFIHSFMYNNNNRSSSSVVDINTRSVIIQVNTGFTQIISGFRSVSTSTRSFLFIITRVFITLEDVCLSNT